jgi:hypothetical protein
MNIWGAITVVVVVLLVVALVVARGGKAGRAARRELRHQRAKDGRFPNTYAAAESRRNMMMNSMPGKDTNPGGW